MAIYYFRNVGANWGDAANWSLTDGGGATGAVPTAADDAYFTSNSGNCTVNASARVCKTLVFSGVGAGNYAGTLTMTNGITVSGNVTLSATMTIAGASALTLAASANLRSNGKIWPNSLVSSGQVTYTLLDDIYIAGNINITNSGSNFTRFNGFNIYLSGNLTLGQNEFSGTTTYIFNGTGTFTLAGGNFSHNIIINTAGTLTFSGGFSIFSITITYITGIVIATGSTLSFIGNPTLNTDGIIWGGIGFYTPNTATGTVTLLSNLTCIGQLNIGNLAQTLNINGFTIFAGGNLVVGNSNILGTTNIVLNGTGTWLHSGTTQPLRFNITINTLGKITISGNVYYNTGTFTYLSGTVITKNSIFNISTGTFINCDKINFATISVTAGATLTMNKFFSGSAIQPTRIRSTGANYTIAFQDGFEKITKFTKISNCTISRQGQLLCITDKSNKGGNVGVRYINQLPNGVPKNAPTVAAAMAYSVANISDPNFIIG